VSDVNIKHPFSERFIFNTKCQTEASFIALFFCGVEWFKAVIRGFLRWIRLLVLFCFAFSFGTSSNVTERTFSGMVLLFSMVTNE